MRIYHIFLLVDKVRLLKLLNLLKNLEKLNSDFFVLKIKVMFFLLFF